MDQVVLYHHPPPTSPFLSALLEFSVTLIYDHTVYLGRQLCRCDGSGPLSPALILLETGTIHFSHIVTQRTIVLRLQNKKGRITRTKKILPIWKVE